MGLKTNKSGDDEPRGAGLPYLQTHMLGNCSSSPGWAEERPKWNVQPEIRLPRICFLVFGVHSPKASASARGFIGMILHSYTPSGNQWH